MSIEQTLQNALQAKWLKTDDFEFIFTNPAVSLSGNAKDIFDMCLINLDTPQLTATVTPTLYGGLYKLHQGIYQAYTFSATFRDQSKLQLKKYFTKIWIEQQKKYFDDIKSQVEIKTPDATIFKSSNVLITAVSTSTFNNSNSQVSEFTVEFVASHFE